MYTVWDVETTIKKSFKRLANPFDPGNFVVMSGWMRKGGKVIGEYFGRGPRPADWFIKLLEGTTILVGINIKFDILHAFCAPDHGEANRKAWMKWVAAGGLVWDCQLAEYLLNGMGPDDQMLSMDELAPRYGGNLKFDEVKELWKAGVSTEDIDPDLLRRYLCGTYASDGSTLEHGDIGNTELIWLGQYQRAAACGQMRSILLNMGSLLCTIEMEFNGMAVDVPLGLTQAAELADKIVTLGAELAGYLPADLPFDFNWGSPAQKSAIIFGGAVKYSKRVQIVDEQGNQTYAQMTAPAYYKDDGRLVLVSDADELGENWKFSNLKIVKSGKNQGEYKTKQVTVNDPSKPKSRMEDFYYAFPGVTAPSKRWATATEGQYKTGAEVIAELGNRDIPFLESLSKITRLTKDLGTYYIVTDEETGASKGMLTLVQADGIIHHMLNHTSTVTARFSSSNPNLQNLPKEGKSVVKTLFVSRFKGGKIIQSDFTALEVYVQAILTGDKQLIADLQQGLDMHCLRVSQKEGIPYEDALRMCVTEGLAEWKAKRSKAKTFSFERAYGAGATSISEKNKIPLEEVKALIIAEETRYPRVKKYYEELEDAIKANSKPTRKFYPHPENPAAMCNPRVSAIRTPDNKLYSYLQSDSPEFLWKKGTFTSFSPTEIKNYVVQGEGGEWAKAAMWLVIRAYYARGNFDDLALLVNQVHDALYADADASVAVEAAALLEACMLAASEFMEWYFQWTVPVPVPSATNMGDNMMDEGKMPEGFSTRVHAYRMELRRDYMAGYVPSFDVSAIAA
jgi:DNA polymerase-1